MWPKAFAQFVELAPHISRLLPMADRFFQSKVAGDDASRKAIDSMAEGLRGDLGKVAATHATLAQQVTALDSRLEGILTETRAEKLAIESASADVRVAKLAVESVAADARAAKLAAESLEKRFSLIEARQSRQSMLFAIALVLLVAICVLLVILLARGH